MPALEPVLGWRRAMRFRANSHTEAQGADRVAFHTRTQPLAHDGEQIHKPLAPQQLIKLVLARRVAPHQTLQRGGLIGGEMINVQIRMKAQSIHHEVDEPLRGGAFLRSRKCPIRHVAFLPVFTSEGVTKQIFKPTLANKWVAFKIEKYVPWARCSVPECDGASSDP